MNSSRMRVLALALILMAPLVTHPADATPASPLVAQPQNLPMPKRAEVFPVGTISGQNSAETLRLLLEGNDWMLDLQDEDGDRYRPLLTFFQRSDGSISFSTPPSHGRELLNPRVTIDGGKVKLKYSLSQDCGPRDYSIRLRLKDDHTFSAKGTRERSRCRGGARPVSGTMH